MEVKSSSGVGRWLLLIHQIPPKPDYFRVKIWRRLQSLGAVAIKNSVYALPNTEQGHEDFQWTVREILAGGGEAMVCSAELVDGLSDEHVIKMFRGARDADYRKIVQQATKLGAAPMVNKKSAGPSVAKRADALNQLQRLKRRLAEISAVDFFGAANRTEAETTITAVENKFRVQSRWVPEAASAAPRSQRYDGATWVTRKGIHVDRIASAWLIRRFIDAAAQFKFAEPLGYRPAPGEVRFDMFDAEFTHEGDNCTFEVLCKHFALADSALSVIADIVHDIDLKESKFGRAETSGVSRIIAGISMNHREDEARLQRGVALFDDLYESFHRHGEDLGDRRTRASKPKK